MKSYKPEQGRVVRMAAFWSCALLALFGCTTLHTWLTSFDSLGAPIGGIEIPVVAVPLSGAFLIATAVAVGALWALHTWQQKPKQADLLIETEAELKRVAWPTLDEVINSSIVVIVFVVFLMGYLAGADYVLGRVFRRILIAE